MLRNQGPWLEEIFIYLTQTSYLRKGTDNLPNKFQDDRGQSRTSSQGTSPEKGPGLPVSLVLELPHSWYVGFILSNLKPTSSPTAGNLSPVVLCERPSKLRWKGSLNLLPSLVQPHHLPNLGPILYPEVRCFAIGPDWVMCLSLKDYDWTEKREVVPAKERRMHFTTRREISYESNKLTQWNAYFALREQFGHFRSCRGCLQNVELL